jgi:hypothetical protein
MSDKPWYQNGLRFRCTGCGDCCTGAPGYVWVNKAEIAEIAEFLGVTVETMEAEHVRSVGIRKSLVELPAANWDCTFLDPTTRKCRIYPVRPRQCRTWPFWTSNLQSEKTWEATCRVCPGSGQGDFFPLEEVEQQAAVFRV